MGGQRYIGTSGWHYKHWRGPFYPEKLPASKMLEHYFQHFDTVELNNTFYRLPTEAAVHEWRETTPPGFRFAAKGSRFLTHMKKLKDPDAGIEKFFSRADLLGEKLAVVLFQLPPFWERNTERLDHFLATLPPGNRYAFEFRNETWHCREVYAVLEKHNAAWCSWDLAGVQSPVLLTANFTYVRLHGPGDRYQGSYSEAALGEWAQRVREWERSLDAVFLYFDNDMAGYAVANALRIKAMLA